MGYCGPRGIPYATFLEWDALSQDAAIAWSLREADRCGGCGLVRSDMLDDDGVELREQPWRAEVVHCPGCRDMARAERTITKMADGNPTAADGKLIAFVATSTPGVEG